MTDCENDTYPSSGSVSSKRRNLILGVLAGFVIILSFGSLVYNAMTTSSTDILTVNGKDYTWEEIDGNFDTIEIDGKTGVPLGYIMLDAGIREPEGMSFRFIGADGYQKEIPWSDISNGFINTDERKVIFPDLAKAFWVRDLVAIEVV